MLIFGRRIRDHHRTERRQQPPCVDGPLMKRCMIEGPISLSNPSCRPPHTDQSSCLRMPQNVGKFTHVLIMKSCTAVDIPEVFLLKAGLVGMLSKFRKFRGYSGFEGLQVGESRGHNELHISRDCKLKELAHVGDVGVTSRPVPELHEGPAVWKEEDAILIEWSAPLQAQWIS